MVRSSRIRALWENGYLVRLPEPTAVRRRRRRTRPIQPNAGEVVADVPELGQHTEEVLLELGYSWDEITALSDAGAI